MKVLCVLVVLTLTVGTFSQKLVESPFQTDEHHLRHRQNKKACHEFLKTNECPKGEHCRVRDGKPMCVRCTECPEDVDKPVCGSDGLTYKSHCHLRHTACMNDIRINLLCNGQCPCEERISKPEGLTNKPEIIVSTKESDEYLSHQSEDDDDNDDYRKTVEHELKKLNKKWMKWSSLIKAASENIKKEEISWKDKKTCTKQDLLAMPSRLLDWFHVLKADKTKESRRLRRKRDLSELSFLGTLSLEDVKLHQDNDCHLPVSWMFSFLDSDNDKKLSHEEMMTVEDIPYECCMKPFLESCNVGPPDKQYLTEEEFCNCFTNEEAPCRKELMKVPTAVIGNRLEPLLGAWEPHCDEDGFFHPIQCHENECWCVDRLGVEVEGSRKTGRVQCSDNTEALDNDEEEEREE